MGVAAADEDEVPFAEFALLQDKLEMQLVEADQLTATIRETVAGLKSHAQ